IPGDGEHGAAGICYGAALCAMFHAFIVLYEEPVLRRKFGETYTRYCARVPRWIPRRPGPSDEGVQADS
ncbi:MAG: methyltransferase family protein, partial [Myxococcota bacterium]